MSLPGQQQVQSPMFFVMVLHFCWNALGSWTPKFWTFTRDGKLMQVGYGIRKCPKDWRATSICAAAASCNKLAGGPAPSFVISDDLPRFHWWCKWCNFYDVACQHKPIFKKKSVFWVFGFQSWIEATELPKKRQTETPRVPSMQMVLWCI